MRMPTAPAAEPNPYAAPAASARAHGVAPGTQLEPLTTTIAVWLCLGASP